MRRESNEVEGPHTGLGAPRIAERSHYEPNPPKRKTNQEGRAEAREPAFPPKLSPVACVRATMPLRACKKTNLKAWERLMRRRYLLGATFLLVAACAAFGQEPAPVNQNDINHDRKDIRQDQRDLNHDRKDIRNDQRDLNRDRTDRNQDARDIRGDQRDINHDRADMRRDLAKGDTKDAARDRRDIRHDATDLRNDRRDVRKDQRDINKDKRDLRADRRDARHDVHDIKHDRRDIRRDRHGK